MEGLVSAKMLAVLHFAGVFLGLYQAVVHEPANPAQLAGLYEDRMQRLVRQNGESSPEVARAAIDAARFLHSVGRTAEARGWLERSLNIAESAEAHEWMAAIAPEEALAHLERAVALHRAGSEERARAHTRLGNWYDAHRAPKPALDEYRAAVAIYEKLPAGNAAAALAVALNDLGLALENQPGEDENRARFAEAERHYRRALGIQERLFGPRHGEVGITLNNLAGAMGAQGRLQQAEPVLRRALALLDAALGPGNAKAANCASNLGDLLSALGRGAEAARLYARAIAAFEAAGDRASAAAVREAAAVAAGKK